MSLLKLKLKAQGLVALPVFFMFISCDKLLPTSGSGDLVPVKIRSVSVKGYGEASATRSAGGERRLVGEPIVQDLGNGMLAEISVEEDVSALRADLETDKTFRVIALKHSDQTYVSHADFKVGGSSNYESPDLHVPEGLECDFICISFNDKDAMPAMTASNIGALALNASKDFLYQRIKTSINGNSAALSFTELEHQFTKVTLILDAGSRTINSVSNSIKINSVVSPATFNLTTTTSALSGTATDNAVPFTGWVSTSASVRQDALRLLPTSGTSATLSLPAEAITVGNWKSEEKTISLPDLLVGKNYTIRLKFVLNFAGSNIYWDGEKLTFDKDDGAGNTKYQGVYFRWGSLIGISSVGDYTSGSTVLYKPTNTDAPVGATRTWTTTYDDDEDWTGDGWSNIPSYDGVDIQSPVGADAYTLLAKSDFEHYKGDICNYINPAYRMPTENELDDIIPSHYVGFTDGVVTVEDNEDNQAGRYVFADDKCATLKDGRIFPASGYRSRDSGALGDVGVGGYYWSGSALSGTADAHYLVFNQQSAFIDTGTAKRIRNFPVRCVKN